jgi:hypothetical protein
MTRSSPEASLQMAVVQHLQLTGVPGLLFFRIPNDGKRSPQAAQWEKRMGLMPGAADLFIKVPCEPALFLELKAPGKKQTVEQIAFEAAARGSGSLYAVADNIDDALAILTMFGALRRKARAA